MPNGTLHTFDRHEVGPLVVEPVQRASLAIQVSTVIQTDAADFRIPRITSDPTSGWVGEGEEIPVSEATADEVLVEPKKLAGLSIVSNELAEDSSPEAAALIGDGLARDLSRRVDSAFFGVAGNPALQPGGLESASPVTIIVANPAIGLGPFIDALAAAEGYGSTIDTFVVDPGTARSLAKLTTGTGSNAPLFGTGATNGIERSILGVPLRVSADVLPGTAWGIPKDRVFTVLRREVTLDIDPSPFFTSNRTAIRAVMRIGFGFADPKTLIQIRQ